MKSRIRNEMDGVRRERGSRREDLDLREIQLRQQCGVKRSITAKDVPIPVGLRQAVLVGLRQAVVLQTR